MDIDAKGALADPNSGGNTAMAFGREGEFVLVNGRQNAQINARAGALQRWRIVNTAKSRYFNLNVPGSMFTKIGGDGGLQEYPTKDDYLVLAPGERADVIVAPKGKPGTELQVMSELFNRGYGSVEFRMAEKLFRIALTNQPALVTPALPKVQRTIEPLKTEGATPITFNLDIIQKGRDQSFEYQIRKAVVECRSHSGKNRRDAALDSDQQHAVVASDSHSRLLLSSARRQEPACSSAGMERHRQRAIQADTQAARSL
jgi:FtsP/CotA-like multicopper oxidase with cupredoxin domain